MIVAVALSLYLPGLRWGLPGMISWSQDTIAGVRTIGAVSEWPDDWHGRYPPLHYLTLSKLYRPLLGAWAQRGEWTPTKDGTPALHQLDRHRISTLILTARLATLIMSLAAGIGLWCAAMRLTDDRLASTIASLTLLTGAAFSYFAHLGNVDVPSICWFAWSMLFYVRTLERVPSFYSEPRALARANSPNSADAAIPWTRHAKAGNAQNGGRWIDAALLGVFASMAISTKDAVAGVYPGMAIMLLIAEFRRRVTTQSVGRTILGALFQWCWLIGFALFSIPYLFLNGAFHNSDAFLRRMSYWFNEAGDTLHAQQYRYANQGELFLATIGYAAGAVGWPMVVTTVVALGYSLKRHRAAAVTLLVPAIGYYAIVIAPIHFVYSRFLFVPLAMVAPLVGLAAADFLRSKRIPWSLRCVLTILVAAPTVAYTMGMNLEMMNDSRLTAEAWFENNVPRSSSVGAFRANDHLPFSPQYLPRVHEMGYDTYPADMAIESFAKLQPEYLILSSYDYEDFNDDQAACMNRLVAGKLGYEVVAEFAGQYFNKERAWLRMAGWGAPIPGKISPRIIILRREDAP